MLGIGQHTTQDGSSTYSRDTRHIIPVLTPLEVADTHLSEFHFFRS